MHILTGTRETKKVMYFNSISCLDIRLTPDCGRERYPYLVTVNLLQNFTFQFDPETQKFFCDEEDHEATLAELEKVKEEGAEGIIYIQKQEYVLLVGEENKPLSEKVSEIIENNM